MNHLSRDAIKLLAIFAMLLNHIAHVCLCEDALFYEILIDTGYFTAITMCYFLAEGYRLTRDWRCYARRMLLFALLSQIPYTLAFHTLMPNMLFTLFLCLLALAAMDQIVDPGKRRCICFALVLLSTPMDWGGFAVFFTILFAKAGKGELPLLNVYLISYAAFAFSSILTYSETLPAIPALLHGLASGLGILASGFVILHLYDHRPCPRTPVRRWFFYVFYPAHLLILALIQNRF